MSFIHEVMQLQAFQELFTIRTPLDFVGIGFFFLILYVVVGGTCSMIYNQLKYVLGAVIHRRPTSLDVQPFTRALIHGTAPEIIALRRVFTKDPFAANRLVNQICGKLERDPAPIARSIQRQMRKHQEGLFVDIRCRAVRPKRRKTTAAMVVAEKSVVARFEGNS